MNYSSYPIQDQSQNSKINLMYNSKKIMKRTNVPRSKKMSINSSKNIRKSVEHFSNSSERRRTSQSKNSSEKKNDSDKKDDSVQKDKLEKESNPQIIYMDNDEKEDDDNDEENDIENENVATVVEPQKPKSFLSKVISGLLSIVFLCLVAFIIYAGYMYFIKKKNIFSSIMNSTSESNIPETNVDSGNRTPIDITESPNIPENNINANVDIPNTEIPISETPILRSETPILSSEKPILSSETPILSSEELLPVPEQIIPTERIINPLNQNSPIQASSIANTNSSLNQDISNINEQQEFEMTGGDNTMVSDIINILKKFEN